MPSWNLDSPKLGGLITPSQLATAARTVSIAACADGT